MESSENREVFKIVDLIVKEYKNGDLLKELCLILNLKYEGGTIPDTESILK
jgi:hypothetical protein